MEWIAAVQQAITYMEAHLMEEINYEDVAKQVHISSYEFHRAFSFLHHAWKCGKQRRRKYCQRNFGQHSEIKGEGELL